MHPLMMVALTEDSEKILFGSLFSRLAEPGALVSASGRAETDMHEDRPAFGQRLAELAELGVIEL